MYRFHFVDVVTGEGIAIRGTDLYNHLPSTEDYCTCLAHEYWLKHGVKFVSDYAVCEMIETGEIVAFDGEEF